jgi:hypothetical protein
MNKKQVSDALVSACGGNPFASVNQLSRALKIDKRKFVALMDGVEYWNDGRAHRYMISDVAARIMARSEIT